MKLCLYLTKNISYMKFINLKSPNFSKNIRNSSSIKFVILHYTGMQSKRASIARLTSKRYKVSCHYLIDQKGKIIQMVKDNKIAWHAGFSKWKNLKNLNSNSIGIELVNKGHEFGYEQFPKVQIKSLEELCNKLLKKYHIPATGVLGHSDIAPLRKLDPGEKFPWEKISKKNIGRWYPKLNKNFFIQNKKKLRNAFFKNLYKIGYRYFSKIKSSKTDKMIIKAFQMRFHPSKVDGLIDEKTYKISYFLAKTII